HRVLSGSRPSVPGLRVGLPEADRPAPGHPAQQRLGHPRRRRPAHPGRARPGHRGVGRLPDLAEVQPRYGRGGGAVILADLVRLARGFWRSLTSMRTALILLLLLAIAAVPGSLLPQRNVNPENVAAYLRAHPGSGPWLDRLSFFDVYSSAWFSAIYLLLFVSLVGCLVPRLRHHLRNLLTPPPPAPGRLN